jgi:hypothetical protein
MGFVASRQWDENSWFARESRCVCGELGIRSEEEVRRHLEKVIWQEAFCTGYCATLWEYANLPQTL